MHFELPETNIHESFLKHGFLVHSHRQQFSREIEEHAVNITNYKSINLQFGTKIVLLHHVLAQCGSYFSISKSHVFRLLHPLWRIHFVLNLSVDFLNTLSWFYYFWSLVISCEMDVAERRTTTWKATNLKSKYCNFTWIIYELNGSLVENHVHMPPTLSKERLLVVGPWQRDTELSWLFQACLCLETWQQSDSRNLALCFVIQIRTWNVKALVNTRI